MLPKGGASELRPHGGAILWTMITAGKGDRDAAAFLEQGDRAAPVSRLGLACVSGPESGALLP
jgi:hypothetical protein